MSTPAYIDTGAAPEFFASDVRVQSLGSCSRLLFLVTKFDSTGVSYVEPVASIVVPADQVAAIVNRIIGKPQVAHDHAPPGAAMN